MSNLNDIPPHNVIRMRRDFAKLKMVDFILEIIGSEEFDQVEVAEEIGCSQATISNILNGRVEHTSMSLLFTILTSLGANVSLIVEHENLEGGGKELILGEV